jgi:hypothetical protein
MLIWKMKVKARVKNLLNCDRNEAGFSCEQTFANSGHTCSSKGQTMASKSLKLSQWSAPINSSLRQCSAIGGQKTIAAFTLIEALMALGIMVLFVAACMSAILVNQVATRKAKEEAIAMDFLTKYAESIKALPFTSVAVGQPINELFDGTHGAPLIAIPASGSWVAVNTTAYGYFSPDLVTWLTNRGPQMMVTLTPNSVSGSLHDIEVNVRLDWDPPISRGARQEVQVDFLRTKDTTQL